MSTILIHKSNHIARITLNRPESYNAFNREMALTLIAALKECDKDEQIRVVYLTGSGKAFCSGQDLKEVTDPETNIGFERIVDEHYNSIIKTIITLSKPVVAAVNGVAAGAGANIALGLRYNCCKQPSIFYTGLFQNRFDSRFRWHLFPPPPYWFATCQSLTMLGDKVMAQDAEDMGMIYKCLESESFDEEAYAFAERLAKLPPIGISLTKKLFESSLHNTAQDQMELEKNIRFKLVPLKIIKNAFRHSSKKESPL